MKCSALAAALLGPAAVSAITLKVPTTSAGTAQSSYQYGLIYEDINHSGDGGLYAELIRNRAFQAANFSSATVNPFVATSGAKIALSNSAKPLSSALPWSMTVSGSGSAAGFSNPGYYGIGVTPQKYAGSFYVLGAYTGQFTASFVSTTSGKTLASTTIPSRSNANSWTQHNFTLSPTAAAGDVNNTFVLTFDPAKAATKSLNFNFISVFPPTYNARPNGLRVDLMNAVAGVTPSFMRMPGGNNLEGNAPGEQLKWNTTVGPLLDRPGHAGAWGYYNTDGFGLNELFTWCQDLKMEPIWALFAGHWLDGTSVPQAQLQPYIDDALNQLEYITGSTSTKYGALRASHGYPTPWALKFVEIGNEDNLSGGLASYQSYRFRMFHDAIAQKFPSLTIIASTNEIGVPAGTITDYHNYNTPDSFVKSFGQFNNGNSSVKTFVGEYATLAPNGAEANIYGPERATYPFWVGSVGEAIYLLGMERNSKTIFGAAYAPILQNTDASQWTPDLISYTADTSKTIHSTSWHMLQLLAGTRIAKVQNETSASGDKFGPAYWVTGTSSTGAGVFKAATYNATAAVPFSVAFDGVKATSAKLTVLTAPDAYSSARVGSDPVVSKTSTVQASNGAFKFSLPNYSVAVLSTS